MRVIGAVRRGAAPRCQQRSSGSHHLWAKDKRTPDLSRCIHPPEFGPVLYICPADLSAVASTISKLELKLEPWRNQTYTVTLTEILGGMFFERG